MQLLLRFNILESNQTPYRRLAVLFSIVLITVTTTIYYNNDDNDSVIILNSNEKKNQTVKMIRSIYFFEVHRTIEKKKKFVIKIYYRMYNNRFSIVI